MKYPHAVLFFKAPQLFLVKTRHSGPEWTRQCRGKTYAYSVKGLRINDWFALVYVKISIFQKILLWYLCGSILTWALFPGGWIKSGRKWPQRKVGAAKYTEKNGAIGLALVGDGEGRKCPRQFCSCWLPWHRIMFLVLLKVAADGYTMSCHLLLCALITILMNLYIQDMRCNYHFYPILIKALRRMTIHKGVILHEPADKGNDNNRRLKYESKWEWCFGLCQP